MPKGRQYIMSRFLNCYSRNQALNQSPHSKGSSDTVEKPPTSISDVSLEIEGSSDIMEEHSTSNAKKSLNVEGSSDIMEKPSTSDIEISLEAEESSGIMEKPSTTNVGISLKAEESSDVIEKPLTSNVDVSLRSENLHNYLKSSCCTPASNIVLNHDFSGGLHSWHPNCCNAYVVSEETGYPRRLSPMSSGHFAVVTNRKQHWQGLEQDVTDRVSVGSIYSVCAWVRISGAPQGVYDVLATLKLEYQCSSVDYLFIGRTSVSMESWEKVEGTFSLSTMPRRVIFYLEGPPPGIDLLIRSVVVSCRSPGQHDNSSCTPATNIILNHDFSGALHQWHPNCCNAYVVSEETDCPTVLPPTSSGRFAVITNRKQHWQGLEQDITNRVSAGSTYSVCAWVRISGAPQGVSDVQATLKLEHGDFSVGYIFIGRTSALMERWEKVEGTFCLSTMPKRVIFYLEGPSPGIDLLIRSVVISCHSSSQRDSQRMGSFFDDYENIIQNPRFDDGLNNWSGRGCQIVFHDSMGDGKVLPMTGKSFGSTAGRTQNWNGIEQEIRGRVQRKLVYEVIAVVRIFGNNITNADVKATLWIQAADLREQYISIATAQATDKDWVQLQGKFLVNCSPSRAVIFLEGPPPGTDILLDNLVVRHAAKVPPAPPPVIEKVAFGVNIISNSNFRDGTNGWFPLGNCSLTVGNGSPLVLPPMAGDSLGAHEPLSGCYILVTNRSEMWMGPAQMITDKLKLYLTYQVSAWVRIGNQATRPQNINVALGVDGQWVNGGQVEANDDKWHEIGGSFRIEKQPSKVMVYVQGPEAGVDLMVAGLQIFLVDRRSRFRKLKTQTDKIRKRDVILKFTSSDSSTLVGASVKVKQTQNSFPFGSCISRSIMDNEDILDFFTKNFNWAVFENELKWYWTEPQQGNFNYKDADELLNLCTSNNIELRGHCIFWEVEVAVQPWICCLNKNDMMSAVQSRLTGLLTRYKGKFKHYDVNNDMLHGSFYQDHLGNDIRANMFKIANQMDPSAALFVNDYNIEDGCDAKSSPEKYIQQILDLQEQGAPIGGIGIQGHINSPVGPIVCSALDKLGILGLPIWFTEVDVSSDNEYVRADDLEVMLREVFAHPAVDGVMFWGFWELLMSRNNAHLVNAEGDVNEAGKRYLGLKQEWLSHAHGHVNEEALFEFRGFHGSYEVEVVSLSKEKVVKNFVVNKGEDPLMVSIDL
ncbi:Endo-1,4-beta-xylanase [Handroanthus impetiginosus]|uniref:Endo-1,4-beta-xylanase n=1 Tax=Handroanthus impetiginosus TaxID=429701 RepID=A0A2G9HKR5_9LAMI|nr:Endo-1,4-beta-xylanase [Handroanthus impetiginosus]